MKVAQTYCNQKYKIQLRVNALLMHYNLLLVDFHFAHVFRKLILAKIMNRYSHFSRHFNEFSNLIIESCYLSVILKMMRMIVHNNK